MTRDTKPLVIDIFEAAVYRLDEPPAHIPDAVCPAGSSILTRDPNLLRPGGHAVEKRLLIIGAPGQDVTVVELQRTILRVGLPDSDLFWEPAVLLVGDGEACISRVGLASRETLGFDFVSLRRKLMLSTIPSGWTLQNCSWEYPARLQLRVPTP